MCVNQVMGELDQVMEGMEDMEDMDWVMEVMGDMEDMEDMGDMEDTEDMEDMDMMVEICTTILGIGDIDKTIGLQGILAMALNTDIATEITMISNCQLLVCNQMIHMTGLTCLLVSGLKFSDLKAKRCLWVIKRMTYDVRSKN